MRSNSYSLDLCVVVQHRGQPEAFEGPFTLGLLTAPPTPEGTHAKELQAPGYVRAAIEFGPPVNDDPRSARRSEGRTSFGAIGGHAGEVTHVALFRGDEIVAYGLPIPAPGHIAPGEIAFESGAVRVRF